MELLILFFLFWQGIDRLITTVSAFHTAFVEHDRFRYQVALFELLWTGLSFLMFGFAAFKHFQ